MKQLSQDLRGAIRLDTLPAPYVGAGQVLVSTAASLVSAGTERVVRDFAKKESLEKTRSQPDRSGLWM